MTDDQQPEQVHPLYIRQEAEKVATFFARLYINRGIALFGIGIGFVFALVGNKSFSGWVLIVAGSLLALAAYDKLIYDRAFRSFEKRFSISPKDYLTQNPLH